VHPRGLSLEVEARHASGAVTIQNELLERATPIANNDRQLLFGD